MQPWGELETYFNNIKTFLDRYGHSTEWFLLSLDLWNGSEGIWSWVGEYFYGGQPV